MTATDEIKNRLDLVDIVSETVKLRKAGKSFTGFCPFHTNVHTPAFVVFPDSGTWRCFGQCNEGGDIFKYVMKREGWDFPTTLKFLAAKAGVQLEPLTPQRLQQDESNNRISQLLEEVVIYYRNQLSGSTGGKTALEYLRKRGLTDATLDRFMLGYAPDGWDNLIRHLSAKGVDNARMVEAGLVSERDDGGTYDRFRNRIMIPIRDVNGHMAGFGARILDPNDIPKFLNSPQTSTFDKGRLLYGLDQARKAIRAQDQVVLVEGYLDVILLHQAGYTNTVSPMGTALTEDQLRMLKKYTHRIILALDADAAGQKATLRGLQVAREAMDKETELVFNVQGLLRQESRLQADIRVTTIPEGMDPDEVVLRNPGEWQTILDTAKPLVIHVMDTLAEGQDLQDPKAKREIAAQIIPLIEDVSSIVERDTYRQRLARLLKVDENTLAGMHSRTTPGSRAGTYRARQRAQEMPEEQKNRQLMADAGLLDPVIPLELYLVACLVQQPDLLHRLDRRLQQNSLNRLSDRDFSATQNQQLFSLITQSLSQDELDPVEYIQEQKPVGLEEYKDEMTRHKISGERKSDSVLDDLFRTILRIRTQVINRNLRELRSLPEDHPQDVEEKNIPYQDLVLQYTQQLRGLNAALGSLTRIKS
jgi:DNA primase